MKKWHILLVFALMLVCAPGRAEDAVQPAIVHTPIDITPLFQAILALLASLITARLIPWVKGKTTAQQQAALQGVVDVLVYAAEQLYQTQRITDRMEYVQKQLSGRGYAVDVAQIEAAVKRMKEEYKAL